MKTEEDSFLVGEDTGWIFLSKLKNSE